MRHSRNSRNLIPAKYPKNWPSRNSRNFGPAKIKTLKLAAGPSRSLRVMADCAPVASVKYGPPRGSLTNQSIVKALQSNIVPAVIADCQVVSLRCVFEFTSFDEARKQLAARRRQLEMKVKENSEVSLYSLIY